MLDATAGLGRDGAVLAGLGCEVALLERSPVIAALLRDGLARAGLNLQLLQQDAFDYMRAGRTEHEVVHIDPMYPPRRKTAAARKEMRALRDLAGDDADADRLLDAALAYASSRVVVKRQPRAAFLGDLRPSHQVTGKLVRYDVYFTRKTVS